MHLKEAIKISEIEEIIRELEEDYDCVLNDKHDFVSKLFECCCQVAEYQGLKPAKCYQYVYTLMSNYMADMRDDISQNYRMLSVEGKTFPAIVDFGNGESLEKIAWKMYLERK